MIYLSEIHSSFTAILRAVLVVLLLAKGEWHVAVLDHMLDLLAHCQGVSRLWPSRVHKRQNLLVRKNSMNQYIRSTGQKTGTLKISNQLQKKEMAIALVAQYQNLNSGRRRMKGLNSSSWRVGRAPTEPSSISLSIASFEGSNLGDRNARNKFNR